MSSLSHDQAEGLRRLFAAPQPRIITFLSTLPDADKDTLLINLGVAVTRTGSEVLLVDARSASTGIAARFGNPANLSLAEAIHGNLALEETILRIPQGCPLITLMPKRETSGFPSPNVGNSALLAQAFETITRNSRVVLVDGEIAKDDSLPLPAMEYGEIVLQLSSNPESIKSAYALIKRLNARLGRRPFSILVTGASEREATVVSKNLMAAAERYLAISLNSLGWIPANGQIENAARLGKAVVDAFPLAGAASAFRQIAEHFVSI